MILKINKYEVKLKNICELLEDWRNTYRKRTEEYKQNRRQKVSF